LLTGQQQYHLERAGYFVRRDALSREEVASCLAAAERVLQKCRDRRYPHVRWTGEERDDIWGIDHLFHPDLREPTLVDVLGNPGILGALEDALGPNLRYHLATLLVDPLERRYRPAWRRDTEPDPPDGAQSAHLARWQEHLQFNAALVEDACLYILPGTHTTPLPSEQAERLREDPYAEIPGQVCARLATGDVLFYNANLLHRDACAPGRLRRTLHYAVVSTRQPVQPAAPQPWLAEPDFLGSLTPRLRSLFDRFLSLTPEEGSATDG
jgi:hypothetical protein